MTKVAVSLPQTPARSYTVTIGRDLLTELAAEVAAAAWASRWAVVTDTNVAAFHLAPLVAGLRSARLTVEPIVLPAGEEHKTLATAADLATRLLDQGLDRTSGVIALGGGVIGDLAAFVASIYMRGIPVVQVPTTLLAQVDASIGGKTGVDVPEAKNILGTFWQPRAVFCDLALLDTLPARQWTNGCAEVVKYGVIADPDILTRGARLRDRDAEVVADLVARSCRIKAQIVAADEREGDQRRILNFGHTVGHAIEAESGYTILHGEAVAMGMACAARLAQLRGHLDADTRATIDGAIAAVGLPGAIPPTLPVDGLLRRIAHDKKKTGTQVVFVLVRGLGQPLIDREVTPDLVRRAIEDVTA